MPAENVTYVTNEAEASVVAKIVERHIAATQLTVHNENAEEQAEILILPKGLEAHSIKRYLDEYRVAPERRAGTARLVELASLIDHVNRFKDEDSALFAQPDPTVPTLTGVIDYHRQHADGDPRFGKHRAVYNFPLSDEWIAWLAQDRTSLPQADFASFLEDHITDVADPAQAFSSAKLFAEALGIPSFASPAQLLKLSRGLTVHVDERATNQVNLSTGETTFHFSSEHNDDKGAPLVVPRAFIVQIPVFRAGAAYQFPVRLKYRVAGGRVSWAYELHNAQKAFDDAFREACEMAAEKTELPLFYGAPEAP